MCSLPDTEIIISVFAITREAQLSSRESHTSFEIVPRTASATVEDEIESVSYTFFNERRSDLPVGTWKPDPTS